MTLWTKFRFALFKWLMKDHEWNITDRVVKVEDTLMNSNPPVSDEMADKLEYACLRNYDNICIYIPEDKVDDIKNMRNIYDKGLSVINITNLLKYKTKDFCSAYIMNKATPAVVKIRHTTLCDVEGIQVYVCRISNLAQDQELYKDLLTYKIMTDEYKLR